MTHDTFATPSPDFDQLTGVHQEWLHACAAAIAGGSEAISQLWTDDALWLQELRQRGRPWPNSSDPAADETGDTRELAAAKATYSIAQALTDPFRTGELLVDALDFWRKANVLPVIEPHTLSTVQAHDPRLRSVLDWIQGRDCGSAEGMASLMALRLARELPAERHTTRLTVLFDRRSDGGTASLELGVLPNGPPGLYPHPSRMSFLVSDERFRDALTVAWGSSPLSRGNACVVWSLLHEDDPCLDVVDGSLAAAFAVALDELANRQRPLARFLRLRTLSPRCAVTGRLDATGRILPVKGYPVKIRAAAAAAPSLVMVAPKSSRPEIEPIARQHGLTVEYAETLREAIGATRRRLNRQLIGAAVVAAVLAIASVGATMLTSRSEVERRKAQRDAAAANIAAEAVGLQNSDPRLAALLGLAAHQIAPTNGRAVDAMRTVLDANQGVLRTWQASPTTVYTIAVDSNRGRLYTGGDDGRLVLWDFATGRELASITHLTRMISLDNGSPLIAASDGDTIDFYDVAQDDIHKVGPSIQRAACTTSSAHLVTTAFTDDGSRLLTAWSDMTVATFDAVVHSNLQCLRIRDLASDDQLGTYESATAATSVTFNRDEAVVLANNGRIMSLNLARHTVSLELLPDDMPGVPIDMVATPTDLAVSTAGGVLLWSRSRKATIAYPLGGLAVRPTTLRLLDDQVLIASKDGTAFLPLRAGTGFADDDSAKLRGGPATTAAIGVGQTVAVGEPGGRLAVIDWRTSTFRLPPTPASNAMTFASNGNLITTDSFPDQGEYGVQAFEVAAGPASSQGFSSYKVVDHWHGPEALTPWEIDTLADSSALLVAGGRQRLGAGPGLIVVWDKPAGLVRSRGFPAGASGALADGPVTTVAMAPENNIIVALHGSGHVAALSTADWNYHPEVLSRSSIAAMAVAGHDVILVEGTGESAALVDIDLNLGRTVRRAPAPDAYAIAVNQDPRMMVTLSAGNRVQVWDAGLHPTGPAWSALPGDRVGDIAVSADGRSISLAQGGRVLVYTAATGLLAMPPLEQPGAGLAGKLMWAPNGKILASTTLLTKAQTGPGGVIMWSLADVDWTTVVCRWTGGGLDRNEWNRHIPQTVGFIDLCRGAPR